MSRPHSPDQLRRSREDALLRNDLFPLSGVDGISSIRSRITEGDGEGQLEDRTPRAVDQSDAQVRPTRSSAMSAEDRFVDLGGGRAEEPG